MAKGASESIVARPDRILPYYSFLLVYHAQPWYPPIRQYECVVRIAFIAHQRLMSSLFLTTIRKMHSERHLPGFGFYQQETQPMAKQGTLPQSTVAVSFPAHTGHPAFFLNYKSLPRQNLVNTAQSSSTDYSAGSVVHQFSLRAAARTHRTGCRIRFPYSASL